MQCLSCIFRTVQSAQGWLDFDLLNMSRADLMDSQRLPYLWPSLHADIFSLNLFCRRQKAKEKALRKMKKLMAKSGPALSDKITRWSESVLCDPAFDNTLVRLTQDNRKNSAGCLGETLYNIYHSLNLCFAQQQNPHDSVGCFTGPVCSWEPHVYFDSFALTLCKIPPSQEIIIYWLVLFVQGFMRPLCVGIVSFQNSNWKP